MVGEPSGSGLRGCSAGAALRGAASVARIRRRARARPDQAEGGDPRPPGQGRRTGAADARLRLGQRRPRRPDGRARSSSDRAELDELCEKLLVNPLIEDYEIELDGTCAGAEGRVTFGVLRFPGSLRRGRCAARLRAGRRRARSSGTATTDLGGVDAVVIPGGFSYGDYLRVGSIARFAPAMARVQEFAAAGGPVLGICNGFQVLCEAGLLPGALLPTRGSGSSAARSTSRSSTPRPPGRVPASPATSSRSRSSTRPAATSPRPRCSTQLEANGQVVFRYAPGQNPNGSLDDIAGVSNERGNVVGLMPHPEHAVDPLTGSTDGLRLFESAARALATA